MEPGEYGFPASCSKTVLVASAGDGCCELLAGTDTVTSGVTYDCDVSTTYKDVDPLAVNRADVASA